MKIKPDRPVGRIFQKPEEGTRSTDMSVNNRGGDISLDSRCILVTELAGFAERKVQDKPQVSSMRGVSYKNMDMREKKPWSQKDTKGSYQSRAGI